MATMVILGTTTSAEAHMAKTKYLSVTPTQDGVHVTATMSVMDVAVTLGLGASVEDATLLAQAGPVAAWLEHTVHVAAAEQRCRSMTKARRIEGMDAQRNLSIDMEYQCPKGQLILTDEALKDAADHQTIVTILGGQDGPTDGMAHVLRPDAYTLALIPPASVLHVAHTFVIEGVHHLVTGYDHLLFIVALLLVFGRVGQTEGTSLAVRQVTLLVTAFTAGHSVTLVLSALNVVALPAEPVEAVIALSIVVAAGLNILRPAASHRLWLAATFGLVHGFGFSSVLGEVGLPSAHTLVALFSFNLGIELGQLAFVAVLLMPLIWLARHRWYPKVIVTGGSLVVGGCGMVWLVERTQIL